MPLIEEHFKQLIQNELESFKQEFKLEGSRSSDKYFTRKEAANYLSVSIGTIDNMLRRGLDKYKIGAATRIRKSDIDKFIRERN